MQLDLIDSLAVQEAEAPATSGAPEHPAVLDIGQKFDVVLKEFEVAHRAWAGALSALAAAEQDIDPCESYMAAFKPLGERDVCDRLREISRAVRDRLVRRAEHDFAPVGQRLSIATSDLPPWFQLEKDSAASFDAGFFWKYLTETFGGAAGEKLAWEQAARDVVNAFGMRRANKVETKGAYVVLNDSIYVDSIDKKYGKCRPSYNSQESIRQCCNSLAKFAAWAGLPVLESDLKEVSSHFCYHRYEIESRKQFKCGDGEIVIVTFQTNFEYRIKRDLATQLQCFIGTYAPTAIGD